MKVHNVVLCGIVIALLPLTSHTGESALVNKGFDIATAQQALNSAQEKLKILFNAIARPDTLQEGSLRDQKEIFTEKERKALNKFAAAHTKIQELSRNASNLASSMTSNESNPDGDVEEEAIRIEIAGLQASLLQVTATTNDTLQELTKGFQEEIMPLCDNTRSLLEQLSEDFSKIHFARIKFNAKVLTTRQTADELLNEKKQALQEVNLENPDHSVAIDAAQLQEATHKKNVAIDTLAFRIDLLIQNVEQVFTTVSALQSDDPDIVNLLQNYSTVLIAIKKQQSELPAPSAPASAE